ncbi:MAG: hypothetical protein ABW110_04580 [Steroidobacteraceae bacterium]
MNPTLVIMAVRAALRLARSGEQAFGQYARDRDAMLPLIASVQFPQVDVVRGFFLMNENLVSATVRPAWEALKKAGPGVIPRDFDLVAAEYARAQALQDPAIKPMADEFAGWWVVKQWGRGKEPPGPLARVVLTIVDVAAEFAAHDPKLFGVGGNAEVLVRALATHIAELVPDDTNNLGPKNLLGERLVGLFLKSALRALSEHPEALVEQQHVQQLVKSTLPKLVDALPATLAEQVKWREVMDTLLGPVAAEAMTAVAQDPRAFFGRRFGDEGLLGPLTRTYLLKAAEQGLDQTFTKAGVVTLYRATLAFAAARSDLFIGKPADASDRFLATVFQDLVAVAKDHSPPFDGNLLAHLGASTLEIAARQGSALLDPTKPWDSVIAKTLTPVVAATVRALRSGNSGGLKQLASPTSLEAFIRIIVAQIARTPGMVTSSDNGEVNRLVAAIAATMAADDNLLLSQDDWLVIVAAAAEEVAANPDRLLAVKATGSDGTLLATLLRDLILVAGEQWKKNAREGGTVLFGATLREAMVIAIRASAGQAVDAMFNAAKLKQLAAQITTLVAEKAGKYGSKEWLCLYRVLIMQVIHTGALAEPLDEITINAALAAATGVPA